MKKLYSLVILCCSICIIGCQKEQDELPSNDLAEYTVMLYGCSDKALDSALIDNLNQALAYGSTPKVKMTAMVKFSREMQTDPDRKGTRYFTIAKNKIENLHTYSAQVPLYDPVNIAKFILQSKMLAPAKNYILVLWNHGGGWDPKNDPKSRAIIYDDNLGDRAISLNELVAGIKLSKTQLKMVYYDACLMGMLENLYAMSSVAEYALGAEHLTPGEGGEYTELLKELNEAPSLVHAMENYTETVMAGWDEGNTDGQLNYDIGLTDLKQLRAVAMQMRKISLELVNTYPRYRTAYNQAAESSYYPDKTSPFYDVVDYVYNLASWSGNPTLSTYLTELCTLADKALVCSQRSKSLGNQAIFWSTVLVNKTAWQQWGYGDGSYQALVYDRASLWSNWLKTNESKMRSAITPDSDHEH